MATPKVSSPKNVRSRNESTSQKRSKIMSLFSPIHLASSITRTASEMLLCSSILFIVIHILAVVAVILCPVVLFSPIYTTVSGFLDTHKQDKSTNQRQSERLTRLENDIKDLEQLVISLQRDNPQSYTQSSTCSSPAPSLIFSQASTMSEYSEFEEPPPLEDDDQFELPPPIIEGDNGHAALASFYRSGLVYESLGYEALDDEAIARDESIYSEAFSSMAMEAKAVVDLM